MNLWIFSNVLVRNLQLSDTSNGAAEAQQFAHSSRLVMIGVVTTRFPGFRGEFLWELEIAARQTVAMAETIASDKYNWRPDAKARSVSEVFVHVATGNSLLLDAIGTSALTDLYMQVSTEGWERFSNTQWEFPRLSRGGSRSLTFHGVHPETFST